MTKGRTKKPTRTREATDDDKAIKAKDYPHLKIGGWARREIFGSRASQLRYRQKHYDEFIMLYPLAIKENHYVFTDFDGDKKDSNLLSDLVCWHLLREGHQPNRIDTKGTAVIDKEANPHFSVISGKIETETRIKFIPTKTEKGTADIHCDLITSLAPISWHIEIKTGKDEQSDDQKKVQKKKGDWYCVVRNLDDFFMYYDERMKVLNSLVNPSLF